MCRTLDICDMNTCGEGPFPIVVDRECEDGNYELTAPPKEVKVMRRDRARLKREEQFHSSME